MSKDDVEDYIRERKQNTRSVDDQIAIAHAMWDEEIGPGQDGVRASDLEDELGLDLEFDVGTSLTHLVDIDLVDEYFPPGPGSYVIASWMDEGDGEIVNGDVEAAAREGLDSLVDDLKDGPTSSGASTAADGGGTTTRSVVATEFDLVPDKVEDFLEDTDEPVDVLNDAVEAIEENDGVEVGDDYGEIEFRNAAYRYRLTGAAIELYEL